MTGQTHPNIVFILADNVGWGDCSVYNGTVATPNIDRLAREGTRFNNYNVEAQCTPTRAAIMTGRMPIRTGTSAVPLPGHGPYGLAPWEYTIAKLLSDTGYATALYGKWHLGDVEGRLPSNQGFDEWWGIKNTSDEAGYTSYPLFAKSGMSAPKIWEGAKGKPSYPVENFDMTTRPFMDEKIIDRTVQFIDRKAQTASPFFVYVGLTQLHPPFAVHPDFIGKSQGNNYSDAITEMDYRVGQILDAVKRAMIVENTIVIFSSDNGTLKIAAMGGGSSGPWRGHFMTPPFEGSHRVPALVCWPGKIPAGVVSNEMIAAEDWLPTIAHLVRTADLIPKDRPVDGVNASAFLLGQSQATGRESFLFYGPDGRLMSVKWRTFKTVFRYSKGMSDPIVTPQWPLVFDLTNDPHEDWNIMDTKLDMFWLFHPVYKCISDLENSMAQYRNINPGENFTGYG
jgi:arylsulfatase A-like enzyme